MKKTSLEVDRSLLDLNTVGTISLTKAILPHMIKRREGEVVIVSSVLGKFGKSSTGQRTFHYRMVHIWNNLDSTLLKLINNSLRKYKGN